MTRAQAKTITQVTIDDLSIAEIETASYADALKAIRRMLKSVLQSDSVFVADDRAVKRLGETLKQAAWILSMPIRIQSAVEDARREAGQGPKGREVGDMAITSIHTALVSAACAILGEQPPAPAVQCEHPFKHVTQADRARLNHEVAGK